MAWKHQPQRITFRPPQRVNFTGIVFTLPRAAIARQCLLRTCWCFLEIFSTLKAFFYGSAHWIQSNCTKYEYFSRTMCSPLIDVCKFIHKWLGARQAVFFQPSRCVWWKLIKFDVKEAELSSSILFNGIASRLTPWRCLRSGVVFTAATRVASASVSSIKFYIRAICIQIWWRDGRNRESQQ
jgi:hypothetical protein